MYLRRVTIAGFKNILSAHKEFSPKLNCISGLNGSGKSNLMDAIYYLSMTKSYFSTLDVNTINYLSNVCKVTGEYQRDDETIDMVTFSIEREGGKSFKRNSKSYSKLADHIGLIPIVMVSPYDTCLINESGEERRRFINSILSQLDREYLRKVQSYNQLLSQRNRVLKDGGNQELLTLFSERMSLYASYIYQKRGEFIDKLAPITQKYYEKISLGRERISISYKSELLNGELVDLLADSLERDKVLKYTSRGVHRDDLIFSMDNHNFKLCGSQGQQKSFLIALKLAQFEIMRAIHGQPPLLLLDDVFDKLDITRVESLLSLVFSEEFGQIFISDSNKTRIEDILKKINGESILFEIVEGSVL